MELFVHLSSGLPAGAQEVEIVERKGIGHPDTICDGLAEHTSVRLSRYYIEQFGRILHHNVDKVLLVGGAARAAFGGGEILQPIEIYMAGRATAEYGGERIPIREIAVEACREWLAQNVPGFAGERVVQIIPLLRPGSADLTDLFARQSGSPLANDTSCGAGFSPLTDLENVVLEAERCLNRRETKLRSPEIGEDIKVMGVRRGDRISLTIGCAFIGRHIRDLDDYVSKKESLRDFVLKTVRPMTPLDIDAIVNAADDVKTGSIYLTVTGSSAEAGDDGEVGRGNRTNGIITPYRPMTLEAAAGKNPVSHVGKIYNLIAGRIAGSIAADMPDVADASCILVSRIGHRVSDPQVVDVRLVSRGSLSIDAARRSVDSIVRAELAKTGELTSELLAGSLPVY